MLKQVHQAKYKAEYLLWIDSKLITTQDLLNFYLIPASRTGFLSVATHTIKSLCVRLPPF